MFNVWHHNSYHGCNCIAHGGKQLILVYMEQSFLEHIIVVEIVPGTINKQRLETNLRHCGPAKIW